MKTIREKLRRGTLPRMEFPFLDLGTDDAATCGLPAGRYVLLDAIAVAADQWNSDDLRCVWESVGSWPRADEATHTLVKTAR